MSTPTQPAPADRASALRTWFPVLAVALFALALWLIWSLRSDEAAPIYAMFTTYAAAGLTVLALLLWLLFFAPFRRPLRYQILAVVLVLFGAFVACIDFERTYFDSSLRPHLAFRWERTPDDAVEAHRKGAGGDPIKVSVALSGRGEADVPEFRGRRRDGVFTGPPLARDWSANPPPRLWHQPVGVAHSSFSVVDGVFFTMEQRRAEEAVVCYDLATGKEIWVYSYPAHFKNLVGGNGPRATPTVADGEVYSLGATGKLLCLDGRTGAKKWEVDVLENNANIKWGLSGSPLVVGDLVVVNPGVQTVNAPGTLTAHDRKTGKRVWAAGKAHAGYSSPMLAKLGGETQILLFDGEGVSGYAPKDGTQLWRHRWTTQENIHASQPLLLGDDRVFITSGYTVGCASLRVTKEGDKWSVTEEWRNERMRCRYSSPVLHEGHIYGIDEGVLACMDAKTGKRKWRDGRYGNGQLLLVNGLLLIQTEKTSELVLVEPTPEGLRELGRFNALEGRRDVAWNVPAISGGLVLVRSAEEMACYDLRAAKE